MKASELIRRLQELLNLGEGDFEVGVETYNASGDGCTGCDSVTNVGTDGVCGFYISTDAKLIHPLSLQETSNFIPDISEFMVLRDNQTGEII